VHRGRRLLPISTSEDTGMARRRTTRTGAGLRARMQRHDATTCGDTWSCWLRGTHVRGDRQGEFAPRPCWDRLCNGSGSPWRPDGAGQAWSEGGQAGCSREEAPTARRPAISYALTGKRSERREGEEEGLTSRSQRRPAVLRIGTNSSGELLRSARRASHGCTRR
jgi:hypothetical protein